MDAKDGNSEIISVNQNYNLNDGQIFLGNRKVADISYSTELVGARVDFVEGTSFEDVVNLLKNLTYVNQGEATEGHERFKPLLLMNSRMSDGKL